MCLANHEAMLFADGMWRGFSFFALRLSILNVLERGEMGSAGVEFSRFGSFVFLLSR